MGLHNTFGYDVICISGEGDEEFNKINKYRRILTYFAFLV